MKSLSYILRIVLAVGLVGALFLVVDFSELVHALAQIELRYIIYLLGLTVLLIWISCVKWQLFVRATGHEAGILQLMNYYTMSYFFNMFLPSFIGGDVARSYQLGLELKSQKSAFAATFVERLTGFLAMILLGVVFVAFGSPATAGVEAAVLSVAFLSLLGTLVCFSRTLSGVSFGLVVRFVRFLGLADSAAKLDRLFGKIVDSIEFARGSYSLLVKAFALSFVFHLFAVVNTYVCALAVGWDDANFGSLCMVVPLVLLVSVAPVTPSSVGIQEGAFLYFLSRVGATHGQGLGVALIIRAKNVIVACVGALLYLYSQSKRRRRSTASPDS